MLSGDAQIALAKAERTAARNYPNVPQREVDVIHIRRQAARKQDCPQGKMPDGLFHRASYFLERYSPVTPLPPRVAAELKIALIFSSAVEIAYARIEKS